MSKEQTQVKQPKGKPVSFWVAIVLGFVLTGLVAYGAGFWGGFSFSEVKHSQAEAKADARVDSAVSALKADASK